jgi:hypothetical protein
MSPCAVDSHHLLPNRSGSAHCCHPAIVLPDSALLSVPILLVAEVTSLCPFSTPPPIFSTALDFALSKQNWVLSMAHKPHLLRAPSVPSASGLGKH